MSSLAIVTRVVLAATPAPLVGGVSPPAAPALTESAARAAIRPAAAPAARQRRLQAPEWIREVVAYLLGLVLFALIWAAVAKMSGSIPGPAAVWAAAVNIFSDPFYQKGPNDQGIGWNVLSSLKRVGIGFGLAALVGIPLGFIVGRFKFLSDMAAPIIGEVLDVGLPRPRERLALAANARYIHLRARVLEFLYQKQFKAAA